MIAAALCGDVHTHSTLAAQQAACIKEADSHGLSCSCLTATGQDAETDVGQTMVLRCRVSLS